MAVPTRVRRGGAGGDIYYWDGVNPMTILGGGVGGSLADDFGVGLVGTLSVAEFDTLQQYLIDRKVAFDSIAACYTCPGAEPEFTTEAQALVDDLVGASG